MKIQESTIKKVLRNFISEGEQSNYMFFGNLENIMKQCQELLELDPDEIDRIISEGHDWADDHISVAKENIDQVYEFMMREVEKNASYLDYEDINEGKKKTGTKLCSRGLAAAKGKFKVHPSAYSNGYGVLVCKGKQPGLDGKKRCSPPYC